MKVAVTLRVLFIVTVHWLPEVESQPLQLVKFEVPSGTAVNVTGVPLVKVVEQVGPQFMPDGELVTVPAPVPFLVTFKVC